MENAKRVLSGDVIFADSAAECVQQASVLAITTPWAEFQNLPPVAFQHRGGHIAVLDFWRVLPEKVAGAIEHYLTLGKGEERIAVSVSPGR